MEKRLKRIAIVLIVLIVILLAVLFFSWKTWKGGLKVDRFFCERDNLKISGTVFLPEDYNEELPTVIIAHG